MRQNTTPQNLSIIQTPQSAARPGFTIIEVVLVLAIAGLIMAMVFVALPSMQRQQKNKQRKQSVDNVLSSIDDFRSHNHGIVPCANKKLCGPKSLEVKQFVNRYIDEKYDPFGTGQCSEIMRDPDGKCYYLQINNDGEGIPAGQKWTYGAVPETNGRRYICIAHYSSCGEEEGIFVSEGRQNATAIVMVLNSPDDRSPVNIRQGTNWYCVDNTN